MHTLAVRAVAILAALALTVALVLTDNETPALEPAKTTPEDTAALMKKKLEYARNLLEALTLNDLKRAVEQSERLIEVRRQISFKLVKTPEYELWSDDFTRSAEGIIKAGKEGNAEAAKLSYLSMTMACFNCHTYVRDYRARGKT